MPRKERLKNQDPTDLLLLRLDQVEIEVRKMVKRYDLIRQRLDQLELELQKLNVSIKGFGGMLNAGGQ